MEERRTINAPLRLSTAFMCVSLAAAVVQSARAFLDMYFPAIDATIEDRRASSWSSFDRERSKDEREWTLSVDVLTTSRHEIHKLWECEEGIVTAKVKSTCDLYVNANVFINLNSRCRTKECHVVTVEVARGKLITRTDYILVVNLRLTWSLVACNQRTRGQIYFTFLRGLIFNFCIKMCKVSGAGFSEIERLIKFSKVCTCRNVQLKRRRHCAVTNSRKFKSPATGDEIEFLWNI